MTATQPATQQVADQQALSNRFFDQFAHGLPLTTADNAPEIEVPVTALTAAAVMEKQDTPQNQAVMDARMRTIFGLSNQVDCLARTWPSGIFVVAVHRRDDRQYAMREINARCGK
jgi:hypothetical protein